MRIAHYHCADVRLQQVVQPGRPSPFFKRNLHISTQPVDELQNHTRLGLEDAFHHHLPGGIHHGNRNTFLVHVHADIFLTTCHKGCSFLEGLSQSLQTYSTRGALFIMCASTSSRRFLSNSFTTRDLKTGKESTSGTAALQILPRRTSGSRDTSLRKS